MLSSSNILYHTAPQNGCCCCCLAEWRTDRCRLSAASEAQQWLTRWAGTCQRSRIRSSKNQYIYLYISLSLFLKRRKNKEPSRRKEANRSRTVYITTWGKKGAAAAAPCTHTDTGAQANQHTSSIDLRVEMDLFSFPL